MAHLLKKKFFYTSDAPVSGYGLKMRKVMLKKNKKKWREIKKEKLSAPAFRQLRI